MMKPFDYLLVRLKNCEDWKQVVQAEWGHSITIKHHDGVLSYHAWNEIGDFKLSPVPNLGGYSRNYNLAELENIGMGYAV